MDNGARVNDWLGVVRRARLGKSAKLVALMIATYANPDGTHVFPGIARLAVQCELDYRTVRRALALLRDQGLVEVSQRGARRSGKSDEYRLILAEDLLERCDVPTPAAETLAVERLRQRSTGQERPAKPSPVTGHPRPVNQGSAGQDSHVLQGTGDLPPSMDLYLEDQPPSDERNLRERVGRFAADKPVPPDRARAGDLRTEASTQQAQMYWATKLAEWQRENEEAS